MRNLIFRTVIHLKSEIEGGCGKPYSQERKQTTDK